MAEAGEAILFVGGDAADLAQARPALEAIAKHIYHLGPVGAGATRMSVRRCRHRQRRLQEAILGHSPVDASAVIAGRGVPDRADPVAGRVRDVKRIVGAERQAGRPDQEYILVRLRSEAGVDRNRLADPDERPAGLSPLAQGRGSKPQRSVISVKPLLGRPSRRGVDRNTSWRRSRLARLRVAPRAGAWIETRGLLAKIVLPECRPSRRGVDRNFRA